MSKQLCYFLSVFFLGLLLSGSVNAQSETPNDTPAPQTKTEQSDTPPTPDSLDLETTQQQTTENETTDKPKSKSVKPFDRIYVSGNYRVEIKQGDEHSVEAQGGHFHLGVYRISGNILKIGSAPYRNIARITVYVTTPSLEVLKVTGGNYVTSDGPLTVDCLDIKGAGASKIDLEVIADCIELEHSGAVTTILSGSTNKLECEQTGASKLRAAELVAERVELCITGVGSAHVNVNHSLEVVGSGVCKIRYEGEPEMITKRLNGPCKIVKM